MLKKVFPTMEFRCFSLTIFDLNGIVLLFVSDFGFAQYLETGQDFRIRGTPLYMAPEMLLQHQYDAKVATKVNNSWFCK